MDTAVVSLSSGEKLPNNADNLQNVHSEYRMILCLDQHYQEAKLINNQTIFEYEKSLQVKFGNNNFLVRLAATAANQKAIAVRMPNKSLANKALYAHFKSDPEIQFSTIIGNVSPYPVIFVPIERVAELHNALESVAKFDLGYQICQRIDTQIAELNQPRWFFSPPNNKVDALTALRTKIVNVGEIKTSGIEEYAAVIDNWRNEKFEGASSTYGSAIKEHRSTFQRFLNWLFPCWTPTTSTDDAISSLQDSLNTALENQNSPPQQQA